MKRLANTILLLCDNEECGRMVLTSRQDYEKGKLTKDAVFLYQTCSRCQEPGNFYDEDHYFGFNGEIDWSEAVTDAQQSSESTTGEKQERKFVNIA